MITLLKLVAAAGIAWGVLNPSFTPSATKATQIPRSDANCSCKADTKSGHVVPRSADAGCSCKADT